MKNDISAQIVAFIPRLRRFAFALTGDFDRADDLVQDTCMRAFERIDQWQPGTSIESWMFRIAQNLWKDGERARRVRGVSTDLNAIEHLIGVDGRQVIEHRLTLNAVTESMAQLPADQILLIGLVCIDGLSYKEAAEILEIPIGTVMSRLGRARQKLYELIYEGTVE